MSFFLVFENSFNIDIHMVIFTEMYALKFFLQWKYTLNGQNLKKIYFMGALVFSMAEVYVFSFTKLL